MRYNKITVYISSHAVSRLAERDPRGRKVAKVISIVRRKLAASLVVGVRPDCKGAVHIDVGLGLVAVCCPGMGRWDVATFYKEVEE